MAAVGAVDRLRRSDPPAQRRPSANADERRIHGQGTPEATWRDWRGLHALAPLSLAQLVPAGARLVVVAPHPDDEVLGCGGTLAMLAEAGQPVHVVGVTDGEASHAGSRRWPAALLAEARRTERRDGLARLGPALSFESLAIADGGVTDAEDCVANALERVLLPRDVVLTTWRLDGHPDHEATARAALRAAARAGCACREMPVWMWHWAEPGDARVPWARLRRLELTASASHAKSHAIAAHATQVQPVPQERRPAVLPDWALARLLRPFETFFDPESAS